MGDVARRWISYCTTHKEQNCDSWLKEVRQDHKKASGVEQALKEYRSCLELRKAGKVCPSFPKIFESEEFNEFIAQTFQVHEKGHALSASRYLQYKHQELHAFLKRRKLIYLDTNHWINLRHVLLKSDKLRPEYVSIFQLLLKLEKEEKIVCPLSHALFCELMKQSNSDTRLATARIMDVLSHGVCFQKPDEVHKIQFKRFALQAVLGASAPTFEEWLWTKVGYMNGEMFPVHSGYSPEINNWLQKVSIDMYWNLPLQHFAELAVEGEIFSAPEKLRAEATNVDAQWYRENKVSFKEALAREKAFIVRGLLDDFKALSKEIYEKYPEASDTHLRSGGSVKFGPMNMPSIQVAGAMNAVLITTSKKFTQNDMFDFEHAALAVPYCDAIFADRPMAVIMRNPPLKLHKTYSTEILSEPGEIVAYLQGLH